MNPDAMAPYGQSLLDYLAGDASASVVVRRDDGYTDDLPASEFFRSPSGFSAIEQRALKLCRGHVLDVGAGAGCHSLVLQERGTDVLAIDVSPQAIEVMSRRGVRECRLADIFQFEESSFDTLLMMNHGLGLVEDLSGLDRFLDHAHSLLRPDGQIVCDSLDVRCTNTPRHVAYREANRRAGRYIGEVRMRFEYGGGIGPTCGWLHVDPETLGECASRHGWLCQVIHQEEWGDHLAQLTPAAVF